MAINREKVLAGRKAVDAYREAHRQLHSKPWDRGVPEEHTPLLGTLVKALEELGFASTETDFEPKKTEILAKFWAESEKSCYEDMGIYDNPVYKSRADLTMLGKQAFFQGVELKDTEYGKDLIIDGKLVMTTTLREHISMMLSVQECPQNARVFIGGLGLGIVLLYLVQSGKVREALVCEKDERVISLLGERISNYFDMPIQIIQGDAFSKIKELGRFDWIYIDLTSGAPPEFDEIVRPVLTKTGVYSPYQIYAPSWW